MGPASTRFREWQLIAEEAASCTACDLYRRATQTVFGQGPVPAEIMIVGEQPGDKADTEGRPFVGPAGRMMDRALYAADVQRNEVYVTNAVKHFKWTQRGKRRIHQRPDSSEIAACAPWLEAEIDHVAPEVLVAMGAPAVRAILGSRATITSLRGALQVTRWDIPAIVTTHPSAIVRIRELDERQAALAALTDDLRLARAVKTPGSYDLISGDWL